MDLLCHTCITRAHLSYSVLSLKLPAPPCEVLPVSRLYFPLANSVVAYTVLVKRIPCLLSQNGSVGRHADLASQEKDSADTQCRSDLIVEDDWGLKAVVCRQVQKGISRCREQQQEKVLKKPKRSGQDGQGGNRPRSLIKLHHAAKHPSRTPRTPPYFEFAL